ncbi:MAG TPA: DUF401 family protein [bacterium]|nr:DUF401 family protein [bacterium]
MLYIWVSFLLSLVIMMLIARRNLWLGLLAGALLLGLTNISVAEVASVFWTTVSDASILLLALSVGLIPLIGAILEESGLIQDLVESIRIRSKVFVSLAPAFMGMLTMPGGALLSAPVISQSGNDINDSTYAAINVWYRHILVMVYPLASLLPTTKMAGLDLYTQVLYLLPAFVLLIVLGYFFIINNLSSTHFMEGDFNFKKIVKPLLIILFAPILHITMISSFDILSELALFIAVIITLVAGFLISGTSFKKIPEYSKKMKIWKYFLIIIGMFTFLNMFKASDTSHAIAGIAFSKTFLIVAIGFFLGFATGRIQVPVSILLPIYAAKYGSQNMTHFVFTIMFFSVFIGYVFSPIHPCVSVSIEYFNTSLKAFYKKVALPILFSLILTLTISIIFLG